ncbi:hypothetical protein ACEWY4_013993 [Coilia grayii]|uniref:Coiled-coil domain-containing protein 106-like n=1 Tax=Coilia grayii TaxID=363190 RepID=A0ABD1JR26_9TELE
MLCCPFLARAMTSDSTSASSRSSSSSSTSPTSTSSSSSSSSEEENTLKKKHPKNKKHKKKRRAKSKSKAKYGRRASSPEEVIARYKKVLKNYNAGMKLGKACAKAGVTELTVRSKAAIPEIAIASPDHFQDLMAAHSKRGKIVDLLSKCEFLIESDQKVKDAIMLKKAEGKLIPYVKREKI